MSKVNYESFLGAPNGVVAGEIASQAHSKVYGILNPLIENKSTPEKARQELLETRKLFAAKAEERLGGVYGK